MPSFYWGYNEEGHIPEPEIEDKDYYLCLDCNHKFNIPCDKEDRTGVCEGCELYLAYECSAKGFRIFRSYLVILKQKVHDLQGN